MPGTPEDEAMLREHEKVAKYKEAVREAQQIVTKAKLDAGLVGFNTPSGVNNTTELTDRLRTILKLGRENADREMQLFSLYKEVENWMTHTFFLRFVKAVDQDSFRFRYKQELKVINQISDPIAKDERITELAIRYGKSVKQIEKNLLDMKRQTNTPQTKAFSLDEFFNQTSEALEWLIPELLPKREMVLLVGAPKDGKTLLALDAAFCAATGEDNFLGHKLDIGLKILVISVDESAQSTKAKLLKRGFRESDGKNVRVITSWDISQMQRLEAELEDFRPDLVVVDSLRRISCGGVISENSAEFSDSIYQLKEVFGRYGAASILIHHTNKSPDQTGVYRARGSSAISGACWGQWQLDRIPSKDEETGKIKVDPRDPRRKFSAFNRDSEGIELLIEFNPENNSWESKGEIGGDEGEKQQMESWRDRILKVMQQNSHKQLSGKEIIELLDAVVEKSGVYAALSRMVSKKLVTCQPARGDKRFNVYSLPGFQVSECNEVLNTAIAPPLPPVSVVDTDYVYEIITTQGLEDSLQDSLQVVCNSNEKQCTEYLEPPPDKGFGTLVCNSPEEGEGGGKNQLADYQTDIPAPELKVGDRVYCTRSATPGSPLANLLAKGRLGTVTKVVSYPANQCMVRFDASNAEYGAPFERKHLEKMSEPIQLGLL